MTRPIKNNDWFNVSATQGTTHERGEGIMIRIP